jgi:hypothetical protein
MSRKWRRKQPARGKWLTVTYDEYEEPRRQAGKNVHFRPYIVEADTPVV